MYNEEKSPTNIYNRLSLLTSIVDASDFNFAIFTVNNIDLSRSRGSAVKATV